MILYEVNIHIAENYIHTGSRLQRVQLQRAPAYNEQIPLHQSHSSVKKLGYCEHPPATSGFLYIYLLVLGETQFKCVMVTVNFT